MLATIINSMFRSHWRTAQRLRYKKQFLILFLVAFGTLGLLLLIRSFAVTGATISLEAEQSSHRLGNAMIIGNDTTASNNASVRFNSAASPPPTPPSTPPPADGAMRIIYDTDMGNDTDDALALSMLHAYQKAGKINMLAVTISKDNQWAAPYVDAVNTFYKRGNIPIGVVRNGVTRDDGRFNRQVAEARNADGSYKYPHDLINGTTAPEATGLLRQILASQPDGSVTFVTVGFSTNMARLLQSGPDGHSSLNGRDLVARKVRLLSNMAGNFSFNQTEYNVHMDVTPARYTFDNWPTPIVTSGFEIGLNLPYPEQTLYDRIKYTANHPVRDAYRLYGDGNGRLPHNRPTWDLTSVLYAVEPAGGYFNLSQPGKITVNSSALTPFTPSSNGLHRYLILPGDQKTRILNRLADLVVEAP
jgi:purine nucleosidase